ncbi:hypothetical protein E6H20_05075 [Candidatus Bathyarchaeota archaeon]|nr:MAG: hypothetical protein E6H20_05075 [Candidatus Bathyarchaeota archaeon]
MSSRKALRKTVSGYTRFRNAQSVVPRLRKEPDELARKMLLIGYLTERLEKKKPESVYIVGGQAVETYTAGQFRTGDIDIVTPDSKGAGEILKRIGFEREGMIWLNKTLGLAIHIVGLFAKNSEKARIIHAGPYKVRIVGVEDLIVDRLAAAKFWNSQVDLEQAKALWKGFRKQIDLQYLRKRARDEKVEDVLP